jgi:hypothetical protein
VIEPIVRECCIPALLSAEHEQHKCKSKFFHANSSKPKIPGTTDRSCTAEIRYDKVLHPFCFGRLNYTRVPKSLD